MITVTQLAAEKIKGIKTAQQAPEEAGLQRHLSLMLAQRIFCKFIFPSELLKLRRGA